VSGRDERIVVFTDLPRSANGSPATQQEEWAAIERFGTWTLDALFSCLAQICERSSIGSLMYSASNPTAEFAIMTADTILRNKEIKRQGKQRKKMYPRIDQTNDAEVRALDLTISKNRFGPLGSVALIFRAHIGDFREEEQSRAAPPPVKGAK
jgi:hypothetical protein